MAELIALRTFIKLKVFVAIPESGSISLADLSKATGAQESLLGEFCLRWVLQMSTNTL
jgi:hypothetical protein